MTWTQGRRLESIAGVAEYTYDMSGVRTSKTVGDTTYNYITQNGQVVRQTWGDNTLDIVYDNNNQPYYCVYTPSGGTATTYYYITNLQGDVVRLVNTSGTTVASYTYNAWGKCTVGTNTTQDIANVNPIRYRGYYYDTESGFYYLQSRYYDPVICRFINADAPELSEMTAYSVSDSNLFAYCGNNPVAHADAEGELFWSVIAGAVIGGGIEILRQMSDPAYNGTLDIEAIVMESMMGGMSAIPGLNILVAAVNAVQVEQDYLENGGDPRYSGLVALGTIGLSLIPCGKVVSPYFNGAMSEIVDATIGGVLGVGVQTAYEYTYVKAPGQSNTTQRSAGSSVRNSTSSRYSRMTYRLRNGKLVRNPRYGGVYAYKIDRNR